MATPWRPGPILRATVPVLAVLTAVEIASGVVLDSLEATLLARPSLLVLVPVVIGTAGNLGSVLAARLSTAFHLGRVSFRYDDDTLLGNAAATVALAGTAFPLVGLGAWALADVVATPALAPWTVVWVATASGTVLAVLAVAVAVIATYLAYRFEVDPDDVVMPVVTNVCDVLGVLVLYAVVRVTV
jgi:mgtE-like transporter